MFKLINLANCKRNLDFNPESPWPELLPLYCYEDELLCGFNRTTIDPETKVISLEGQSLPILIKTIHPNLSFPEVARLVEKLSLSLDKTKDCTNEVWNLYGYHARENLIILAQKITQLPRDIQRWLSQKKFSPQDLAPLRALNDLKIMNDFWDELLISNPSKSEGVKWIELLVELLLMDFKFEQIHPNGIKMNSVSGENSTTSCSQSLSTSLWLSHLQALRYPLSTNQDLLAETKVRSLHWPAKSEARWSRRGDRSGIELKLFFSNPSELKLNLVRLEKVSNELENNNTLEELWSKN